MVRVRTDEKRRQIVSVASELFQEHGYLGTSMSQISEKVGGSKATLYGYFKSKEELLEAALAYDVTEEADRLMQEFLSGKDLREGLITLGKAYLFRRLSRGPIANVRIVATTPEDSTIGKDFYNRILGPAWRRLASRFQMLMDAGFLKPADPWIAAMHWKGLCEWDMFERRLLNAIKEPDPDEIDRASVAAADAFLTLYGSEKTKRAERAAKPTKTVKARRRSPKKKAH